MSKEELLKIYSAYLPYKLELSYIDCTDVKRKAFLTGISNDEIETTFKRKSKGVSGDLISWDGNNNVFDSQVKPILWSMDMLTQPIEHNRETFIPIERIQDEFELPENLAYLLKDVIRSLSDFFFTKDLTDVFRFQTVIDIHYKLLEWHFNVFNLPDSAYIKKENLKK